MALSSRSTDPKNSFLFDGDVRLFIDFYPAMLILSLKGRASVPGSLLATCSSAQLAGFTLSDLEGYLMIGRVYTLQLEPSEEVSPTAGANLTDALLTEIVDLGYLFELHFQMLPKHNDAIG